jgi:uncharacterized membrane protein YbhN (UPF0104 family)
MPTEPDWSSARIRRQIQLSMTVGLVLFVVLLVAFALLLILQNADDASAVSALRAIIYVAATCFVLDAVFLLTLVAHTLLALLDQNDKSASSEFNDLE